MFFCDAELRENVSSVESFGRIASCHLMTADDRE
jgi:hypothetical protein